MIIQVITGSVRKNRIGDQVATWVYEVLKAQTNHQVELVDLADYSLPMNDEPYLPKTGNYTQEHTKAFSKKIAAAKAYVFVTPQYNWLGSPALINAINHLYNEWNNKLAAIVTYGFHGDRPVAKNLEQLLNRINVHYVANHAKVVLSGDMYNKEARIANPELAFAPYKADLQAVLNELLTLTPKV